MQLPGGMRGQESKFLLAAVLLLGFAVRLLFLPNKYLYGNDPYFHYSNFLYLIGEAGISSSSPSGAYLPAMIVYTILGPLGLSPYDCFRLTAPIFGVLTIIPAYLITKRAFDRKTAMLTAFILAVLPAFISRTIAGNYRGDPFALFFYIWGFYFFLASAQRLDRKLLALTLLAALAFALSGVVWTTGYFFAMMVITVSAILYSALAYVWGRGARAVGLSYALSAGLSVLFLKFLIAVGVEADPLGLEDFYRLIFPLALGTLLLLQGLERVRASKSRKGRTALVTSLLTLGAVVVYAGFSDLVGRFLTGFGRLGPGVTSYVSELQMSSSIYWEDFSLFGIVFVVGLFYTLRSHTGRYRVFLITWTIASLLAIYIAGQRGAFTASIAIAIMAAVGLVKLLSTIGIAAFRERPWVPKLLLFLVLLYPATLGIEYADGLSPKISGHWIDALEWVKDNTPKDSVVLSWWEYGTWIMALAEREPVVSKWRVPRKSNEIAEMLLATAQKKVERVLKKYSADYVVIPSEMVLMMPNLERALNTTGYTYPGLKYRGTSSVAGMQARRYGEDFYLLKKQGKYYGLVKRQGRFLPVKLLYYSGGEARMTLASDSPALPGTYYYSNGQLYLPLFDISDFVLYIPPKSENTFLTSLLLERGERFGNVDLVYRNPQVKIYRVK